MLEQYRKELEVVVLATIAGALGYLMRTIRRGRKVRALYVLLEAGSSGFVGYMVFLLCRAMHVPEAWLGPVVGIFGWLGASSSIAVLERIVLRKLLGDSNAMASTGERPAVVDTDPPRKS
jgi:hypothetical protein